MPKAEKFYVLLSSRAVAEFLTNTGFTASSFLGTLLVAFAQIKQFHESRRCSKHTLSTWLDCSDLMSALIYCTEVQGNKSRGFTVKGNISKKVVLSIVMYVPYFLDYSHTLEVDEPCTQGMFPILMSGTY